MNASDLKSIIPDLQNQTFVGISDGKARSMTRIYFALYNLVCVNALEDEYGAVSLYESKLKMLFDILLRRCELRSTLYQRAALYNQLSFMTYNMPFLTNESIEERLWEESQGVIDEYIENFDEENYDSQTLYLVLRLILSQWYGFVDEGDEMPLPLSFLKQRIRRWICDWENKGGWPSLSVNGYLQRILILAQNSFMMNVHDYDDLLMQIYAMGMRLMECHVKNECGEGQTQENVDLKVLLFEVLQQNLTMDSHQVEVLHYYAQRLESRLSDCVADSDVYWETLSISLEQTCCELSQQFQQNLFAGELSSSF